ncbi:GTPase ObgE [Selenomonadales bacterium OttesenSCG-928-I06]|nr:GTPase ObgE [Selenomonadales bacterium OttesenSCG-928-I06]
MFIDKVKITVKAGSGGHGMSSFRREKYVPKGGPSGGDGGRGGSVILVGDNSLNTLIDFRYKKNFKAKNGDGGQTSNMHGKGAENLYIKVPLGTVVKDIETGQILGDITEDFQELVIAKGGRGGRGNARFVTSVKQAPTFAELGEPGEEFQIALELKLLADIGLVGYPSVGKSSILSVVSDAKPEIAAYHFTTLSPILGVVRVAEGFSFVLADIPGIIEGAHAGHGLGHEFLRHIERTKILIHVLDVSGMEGRDPIEDYHKITNELSLYNEKLATRVQIVAANKMDLPDAVENYEKVKTYLENLGLEVFPISAATGEGMTALINRAGELLKDYKEEIPEQTDEIKVYTAEKEEDYEIIRGDDGAFEVKSKRIEKLIAMTNFANDEAVRRFQVIFRNSGIEEELKARGIQEGDTVRIAEMEFEFR